MSYGFANAASRRLRYVVRGALDFDRHANATYQRMIGIEPICCDITTLTDTSIFQKTRAQWRLTDDPLLVIGCAPCQGFSSHRKKDQRTDTRNSMLRTFAKIALRLQPELIVMENVPEIFHEDHWAHFAHFQTAMHLAGYSIRARVYNLAQFGVPQERFRALVVASKSWRYFDMPAPTRAPHQFTTVRQAIGHLPPLEAGGSDPSDLMHITSRHRPETVALLRQVPPDGGSRRDLPKGLGPRCLQVVDGFRDVYGRMWWDRPANAITTRCRTPSAGRYAHPEQHRGLSVREAGLLQGFPADFHFEGPFDDKFKQVGNAVSPMFSRAVARHLAKEWFSDHERRRSFDGDVTKPISKSFSSAIASIKRRMRQQPASTLAPI